MAKYLIYGGTPIWLPELKLPSSMTFMFKTAMITKEQNQSQKNSKYHRNEHKINNFWISLFLFSTFILLFENGIFKLFRSSVIGDIYYSFNQSTWIATLLAFIFTLLLYTSFISSANDYTSLA